MVRGFEWVRMEWGWSGDGKDGSKGRIIAAKSGIRNYPIS